MKLTGIKWDSWRFIQLSNDDFSIDDSNGWPGGPSLHLPKCPSVPRITKGIWCPTNVWKKIKIKKGHLYQPPSNTIYTMNESDHHTKDQVLAASVSNQKLRHWNHWYIRGVYHSETTQSSLAPACTKVLVRCIGTQKFKVYMSDFQKNGPKSPSRLFKTQRCSKPIVEESLRISETGLPVPSWRFLFQVDDESPWYMIPPWYALGQVLHAFFCR